MPKKSGIKNIVDIVKKPSLWGILVLIALITVLHYAEHETSLGIYNWITALGLTRHAFDRILYLAPIAWGGFTFGWVGGITVSLVSLAAMLPRALLISAVRTDALLETGAVFIIGNILAMTLYALRKERLYRQQLEVAHGKMRFYLREVNKAQEEERKRISHELHDDSIQALVVLSRQLDALTSAGTGLSDEHRGKLEKLRQDTNNIMTGIRRLSQDLRPASLERLGLISALESLAAEITRYSGIPIAFVQESKVGRLSEERELVIFRIVQEALRNMQRHSGATAASIKVNFDGKILDITITDNGKGFKSGNLADLPSSGKLGLTGMQERAQLIGASLNIQSQPGHGTSIHLSLDTAS